MCGMQDHCKEVFCNIITAVLYLCWATASDSKNPPKKIEL